MRKKFRITYKENLFNFELDTETGDVWLVQNDKIPNRIGGNQIRPARNIKEAHEVAEQMLYSMGY